MTDVTRDSAMSAPDAPDLENARHMADMVPTLLAAKSHGQAIENLRYAVTQILAALPAPDAARMAGLRAKADEIARLYAQQLGTSPSVLGVMADEILALSAPAPEPGDLILKTGCPCCGAALTIEHGDEERDIAVLGDPAAPEPEETIDEIVEQQVRAGQEAIDALNAEIAASAPKVARVVGPDGKGSATGGNAPEPRPLMIPWSLDCDRCGKLLFIDPDLQKAIEDRVRPGPRADGLDMTALHEFQQMMETEVIPEILRVVRGRAERAAEIRAGAHEPPPRVDAQRAPAPEPCAWLVTLEDGNTVVFTDKRSAQISVGQHPSRRLTPLYSATPRADGLRERFAGWRKQYTEWLDGARGRDDVYQELQNVARLQVIDDVLRALSAGGDDGNPYS